jgi:dihydrofolate synthase/folylpolyglutamate synthase
MSWPLPPTVAALLDWAQAVERGPEAKRVRVPLLLEPWLPWLRAVPVVKVAGTNGKGSACALLSAVLRRGGRRPGLFTSPHLVRVNERFRIDERDVDTPRLETHAARVFDRARALVAREGEAVRPTFFEALLAVGLDLFREAGCDALVCEAGVGGAHDATSLLPGALGAITSIGHDHQDVLGETLAAIAADKAGIVGPGARLVIGPGVPPDLLDVVAAHAPGVERLLARRDGVRDLGAGEVELATGVGTLRARLPLQGPYQIDNLATVAALTRELVRAGVLRDEHALSGIEDARWPGRFDRRPGSPALLLDAAHNVDGLLALGTALDGVVPFERRLLGFGLSGGKDAPACAALLPRLAPRLLLVEGFHRARPTGDLRAHVPSGVAVAGVCASADELLEHARGEAATHAVTLVVCGSIFLLGEVLEALERRATT